MKAPIPLNDLDRAIMAFQRSPAALPDLMRQLCAGNLWLLVPYHPEVANQKMTYLEGDPLPFARIKMSKGAAVAVFSSEARALEFLKQTKVQPRTFMPAAMAAQDVLGMLGKLNLIMSVNMDCATGDISVPPESLLKLASGKVFQPPPDGPAENLTLNRVDPADYPTDLVQAMFEVLRQHPQFRAAWIFTLIVPGAPAPARKPYYIMVFMEPRAEAVFNDFCLVAKSVNQNYEVNLSWTPANQPEYVADLFRQAPPFYVAADYRPPVI